MRYETPGTAKEAAGLLAGEKGAAFLLAGGTDLLVKLKMGVVEPDLLVDIKRIPNIDKIQTTPKGFVIGAAVSGAEITEHKGLAKAWPGLVEAANLIGSDQIQGRATLAGNLCNASPAADSVPALIAAGAKAVIVGPQKKRTVAVEKVVTDPHIDGGRGSWTRCAKHLLATHDKLHRPIRLTRYRERYRLTPNVGFPTETTANF